MNVCWLNLLSPFCCWIQCPIICLVGDHSIFVTYGLRNISNECELVNSFKSILLLDTMFNYMFGRPPKLYL